MRSVVRDDAVVLIYQHRTRFRRTKTPPQSLVLIESGGNGVDNESRSDDTEGVTAAGQ